MNKFKVENIFDIVTEKCADPTDMNLGMKKKVKVSPLQAMKAHRGCGCKGPHIHSHGTRLR